VGLLYISYDRSTPVGLMYISHERGTSVCLLCIVGHLARHRGTDKHLAHKKLPPHRNLQLDYALWWHGGYRGCSNIRSHSSRRVVLGA